METSNQPVAEAPVTNGATSTSNGAVSMSNAAIDVSAQDIAQAPLNDPYDPQFQAQTQAQVQPISAGRSISVHLF